MTQLEDGVNSCRSPSTQGAARIRHSIIVDGRLADPAVSTEVTINEEAAQRLLGSAATPSSPRIARTNSTPPETESSLWRVPTTMTVVGVTRRPADLVGRLGGTSIYEDTSGHRRPGVVRTSTATRRNWAIALAVTLTSQVPRARGSQALEQWAPGRPIMSEGRR
jgi:hypothetical protein